jgi:hypothetical protein
VVFVACNELSLTPCEWLPETAPALDQQIIKRSNHLFLDQSSSRPIAKQAAVNLKEGPTQLPHLMQRPRWAAGAAQMRYRFPRSSCRATGKQPETIVHSEKEGQASHAYLTRTGPKHCSYVSLVQWEVH